MLNNSRLNSALTLSQLLGKIFENFIGFTLILIVVISTSIYMSLNSEKVFEIRSLLQMEKPNRSPFSQNSGSVILDFGNTNLNEQSFLYLSRSNLKEVTKRLKLNYLINGDMFDHERKDYFETITINSDYPLSLIIEFDQKNYSLSSSSNGVLDTSDYKNLEFNMEHKIGESTIRVDRNIKEPYQNEVINLAFIPEEDILQNIKSLFLVNTVQGAISSRDTLFEAILYTSNINLGKKILNEMNEIYIKNSVEKNAAEASTSVGFIDSQIKQIKRNLIDDENVLNEFRSKNMLIRESEESKAYFSTIVRIDTSLSQLTVRKAEMKNFYEPNSQALLSLENQIAVLEAEKNEILGEISTLPAKERELLNLTRNVQLNQNILEALQTRKLEYSIVEASTLSDVSIVDSAYVFTQVAPRPLLNTVIATIIALLFSMLYVVWRAFIQAKITSPGRIFEINPEIKSLGLVPNTNSVKDKKYEDELKNSLAASFFLEQKSLNDNLVFVTGSLMGVGKSHVSKLLARIIAETGYRVLLIDTDYRRGSLYKEFDRKRKKIISIHDFSDYESLKTNEKNLYLVDGFKDVKAGALSVFDSNLFKTFLDNCKSEFDFVVLDTAPTLMISDPLIISQYAKYIIHVARHNQTTEREFLESYNQIAAIGEKQHFYIYNDFKRSVGSYFYNYYTYYQSRYYEQYTYTEKEKNDEKTI